MNKSSLFDRVGNLVEEIGAEKKAAAQEKTGMEDPGGAEGPTTHPSKKPDVDEQGATEGSQSADNTRIVKETIPDNVDEKAEATESNAPKVSDTQQGSGGLEGKPTGEDSATEDDYKGTPEGDKRKGDQGGTTHPATGDYGEKYSADAVAAMDDEELLKAAADLGNEIVADIATGKFAAPAASTAPAAPQDTDANLAAAAGEKAATDADVASEQLEELASGVVQQIVKAAYHQADLVTDHVAHELSSVKTAMRGVDEDPTGGAGEGEDHGTEAGADPMMGAPAGADGAELPGGAEALLAAMGGGGPEMGAPEVGAPEVGGPEMGAPEVGNEMGEEMGGAPPELGGMGDEAALQQLAAALLELGIPVDELAAAAAPQGAKIASAVQEWQRSGKFTFEEAKKGSAERKVRDYMKGFITELYQRSQK